RQSRKRLRGSYSRRLNQKAKQMTKLHIAISIAAALCASPALADQVWWELYSPANFCQVGGSPEFRPPRTITESRYEGVRRRDSGRQDSGSRRTLVSRMG